MCAIAADARVLGTGVIVNALFVVDTGKTRTGAFVAVLHISAWNRAAEETGGDFFDFQQLDNGLLGITVEGDCKVSVVRSWQQEDGLNVGDVECLIAEAESDVPERYHELPSVLRALFRHPVVKDLEMDVDYDDARHIGWRLTELLPLDKQEKQRLAELQDPLERLDRLQQLLEALEQGG